VADDELGTGRWRALGLKTTPFQAIYSGMGLCWKTGRD